jgi:hypothetical protein
LALNTDANTAAYQLTGATVLGTWNFAGSAQGALSQSNVDKSYQVTFSFDEIKREFWFEEATQTQNSGVSFNPLSGDISLGASSSGFKGKQWGTHEKSTVIAFGGKPGSDQYSYDFQPDKIKQPVIDLLKNAGWTERKKGLFGSLFGK